MQYIESPNKYKGRNAALRVIVWHDMEAPEASTTAESVGHYFQKSSVQASAHLCVDNDSVVECVKPQDTAWHAPGANSDGYGIELAGYARQSAAEWTDAFSKAAIHNAAKAVAPVMKAHGIPARFLTDAQLADGKTKGMTTHAQVSRVFKKSDHSDPGAHFPTTFVRDEVAAALSALSAPAPAKPVPAKPATPAPAPKPAAPAPAKPAPAKPAAPAQLVVDGDLGPNTIKRWQQVMGTPVDGKIGNPSTLIAAVQKWLVNHGYKLTRDGVIGPNTIRAIQKYLGVHQDGVMGHDTVCAIQKRLNTGRF